MKNFYIASLVAITSLLYTGCDKPKSDNALTTHKTVVVQLTEEQMKFVNKLSPLHKDIFCTVFNENQRDHAIQISKTTSISRKKISGSYQKELITPDAAMESVLRSNRKNH